MNIKKIFDEYGMLPEQDYFLTGSRALDNEKVGFKVSTDDSDIDIVIDIHFRHLILDYLTANKVPIEFSCYNGGFRFQLEGAQYNIITGNDIEFMAWREALAILQLLIKAHSVYRNVLSTKPGRYCMYETLRAFIKFAITLSNNTNK